MADLETLLFKNKSQEFFFSLISIWHLLLFFLFFSSSPSSSSFSLSFDFAVVVVVAFDCWFASSFSVYL